MKCEHCGTDIPPGMGHGCSRPSPMQTYQPFAFTPLGVQVETPTLRDYFAGLAMQSIRADKEFLLRTDPAQVSDRAYDMADAMLKAREGK